MISNSRSLWGLAVALFAYSAPLAAAERLIGPAELKKLIVGARLGDVILTSPGYTQAFYSDGIYTDQGEQTRTARYYISGSWVCIGFYVDAYECRMVHEVSKGVYRWIARDRKPLRTFKVTGKVERFY
jgi:hypothetical protein